MGDVIFFPFFMGGDETDLDLDVFFRMFYFLNGLRERGFCNKKSKGRKWLMSKTEQELSALVNSSEELLWMEYTPFYFALLEEVNERKAKGMI